MGGPAAKACLNLNCILCLNSNLCPTSKAGCVAQGLEAALPHDMPTGRSTPEQYSARGVIQRGAAPDCGHRGFGEGAGRPASAAYSSHQHVHGSTYAY